MTIPTIRSRGKEPEVPPHPHDAADISGEAVFTTLHAEAIIAGSLSVGRFMDSGTSFPASPEDGELFHRTDENRVYRYDLGNTAWLPLDYIDAGVRLASAIIGTAHIVDLNVTTGKIALLAVDTAQIAALAVEEAKIGALAVTNAKIDALAVDAAKIALATITDAQIASLDADKITAGTLIADRIAAGSLQVEKLIIGSFDNLISNPGFEVAAIDTTDDPHDYNSGTGGTWQDETVAPHSGARAAEFLVGSQASNAFLFFDGDPSVAGAENGHPACAPNDQFLFGLFAAITGASPTIDPRIRIVFYDETNTVVGSATETAMAVTGSYVEYTVTATAPAGATYVTFDVRVPSGNGATVAVSFDSAYARRMVSTPIIEDQAVDIVRMLNPVFQDGGNAKADNVTVTTTKTEFVSDSLTIPSWVGSLNCLMSGSMQMTETAAERLITLTPSIGGTDGADSNQEINNANSSNETITFPVQQQRLISAPGSTVAFALDSKVSTGTNTSNQHEFASIATGIR